MGAASRVGVFVVLLTTGACFGAPLSVQKSAATHIAPAALQSSTQSSSSHKTTRRTTVSDEDAPDPNLAKAESLIQQSNFTEAEALLRKVIEKDPTNNVAWFELGFVENALKKPDESIAAYRKSVEAKPGVFEPNLNLGLQLAKKGDPDAEKYLRAATQLKPTSHVSEGQARAWLSLGHVLEKKSPDEALAAYQKAAALDPKDAEPHLAAGLILEQQNKFADAEQQYKQGEQIDPTSVDAAIGLSNIYMRGKQFPEAEAELRKVVAAHPDQPAAKIQLGRVLAAEGKNDDAIARLEDAAKQSPNDLSVQRDLADLYFTAGKADQAQKAYQQLIAAHPNDPELHQSLGQALLKAKKFPEAQQEFLTAINQKPDLAAAYGDLAFAASENKNYPLVIKALDLRAKQLPEIPITYFLRASAYDHLRDVKQASANYHLFLQTANGKFPEQEWQAKHRLIALEPKK